MDYNETEYTLYQKAASFNQAILHKLGHPVDTGDTKQIFDSLKPEVQKKITEGNLRIFESQYGWGYTTQYGRAGEITMLTKDDLK
jgi:hypothetical protein